jgi:hypothetical protein
MKSHKLLSTSILAVALVCTSVSAQPAPQTSDAQAANSETVPAAAAPKVETKTKRADRPICKVEQLTGTRLKRKLVCRTAKEWRDIRRGWQRNTKDLTDRGGAASQNGTS